MIRWKVINGCFRSSCMVVEKKYIIKYKKGKITKAEKGTLGIFTFDTEQHAINFVDRLFFPLDYKIIKVESIGRGKKPKKIGFADCLLKFYGSKDVRYHPITTPKGTICYPAVKVLE